jgi:hypothetical protein
MSTPNPNTEVRDPHTGCVLGYYFYDRLSHCYMAVRSDGGRATAFRQFEAVRFIEGES